ncbi:hypothetical protein C791_7885 [Amycolatopsis azurea DSM 43854]|uniref:Uncharacterized protein n=1 Tax=Amycolatopsis azurea DSM 43854 TaxID=1238180 RepID=M2PTN9_9PSEU|nr:hypothetical protein C791_7885 [Amycolatopsis azurea DSM 43854]
MPETPPPADHFSNTIEDFGMNITSRVVVACGLSIVDIGKCVVRFVRPMHAHT